MASDSALLQSIAESVLSSAANRRTVVRVGPFAGLLDPDSELVWFSYAVPVAPLGAADDAAALAQLRHVFTRHRRALRFEFCAELWPELPALLEASGLVLQGRHPMMLCAADGLRPAEAPAVAVRLLTGSEDDAVLGSLLRVQSGGFDDNDEPSAAAPDDVARLRQELHADHLRAALATIDAQPAAAGALVVAGGVAELAGVATLPRWRRRGAAAALSSVLVRDHFSRGGTLVWLSAADAAAQSVYRRIGFRLVGTQLHYGTAGP